MPSTRTTPTLPRQRGRRTEPVVPLGSLTQAPAADQPVCGACGTSSVTRLAMRLTDGTPVVFSSCRRCEHRAWDADGDRLDISNVLDRTRRPA